MIILGFFVIALIWYLFVSCSKEAEEQDKPIAYLAAVVLVACLLVWGAL